MLSNRMNRNGLMDSHISSPLCFSICFDHPELAHDCYSIWLTAGNDTQRYIQAVCRRVRGCRRPLYQPPWSLEELLTTNDMLYSAYFTSAFIVYLFDHWGGSVRYVLHEPSILIKCKPSLRAHLPLTYLLPESLTSSKRDPLAMNRLHSAIAMCDLTLIKHFTAHLGCVRGLPGQVAEKLMHLFPTNPDMNDDVRGFRALMSEWRQATSQAR